MYRNSYVEDEPYEGLIGHSLRIGDSLFHVPPTSIKVQHQMKNERVQLMRSRHSVMKNSGYFKKSITITLFFPNRESINDNLRPLLSQSQKVPFLPIENELLNNNHGVQAVAINSVSVQSVEGFPHCLVATITCNEFNPATYIYDEAGRNYAEMFNWPLFRWFYKRSLIKTNNVTYYQPLYQELDNEFTFSIANEEQLAKLKELKRKKKELAHDYMKERERTFWGVNKLEKEFFENMDAYMEEVNKVGSVQYDPIDTSGLILKSFSAMVQHNLTEFQFQMDESPGQQYLGSQENMYILEFETTDSDLITILTDINHKASELARNYNQILKGGAIKFDSQITRLFGTKFVTIEDLSFNTSADHTGVHKISMTVMATNKVDEKIEEVSWISKGLKWNISAHDGTTILGSLTPELIPPDFSKMSEDEVMDYLNPFKAMPFANSPMTKEVIQAIKNVGSDLKLNKGTDKKVEYEAHVKENMRVMELYPDLELPTYDEVEKAGFKIKNPTNGHFVDPDFFLNYGAPATADSLDYMSGKNTYRDKTGGVGIGKQNEVPSDLNAITKEQMNKAEAMNKEENSADKDWSNKKDIDNLTPKQFEAYIRQQAPNYNIKGDFAVALAQTFDPKLRQFYNKGLNEELNYRQETANGIPVSMNTNLQYEYGTSGSKKDTRYYGTMKVPSVIADSEGVAFNIKNNIASGLELLDQKLKATRNVLRNAKNKGYDVDKAKNILGIKNVKGSSDEEALMHAGAFMMYFGMEKEFNDLIKSGKQPNSNTLQLVKKMLKQLDKNIKKEDPSANEIEKDLKDVQLSDIREKEQPETATPYSGSTTDTTNGDLEHNIDNAMLLDATMYDVSGRLIRAYPTYLMEFIDEGKFVGSVKLSDQFFQYHPIKDIMYVNNRKNASSTLYLEMSNVYGTLSDSEAALNVANTSYREMFQTLTMPGIVAQNAERTRNRWQSYRKNIFLTTGVRIHFRLGYSANALALPTIMNGTITSIQNNDESISVVAQDDGYELANKLRVQADDETGGLIFARKEPTEILDELLSDSQGLFKNVKALFSNKEYEFHSLGIMHFGSPGMPQGLAQLKSFIGGAVGGGGAGAAAGAGAGVFFGGVGAIPGAIIGGVSGAVVGGLSYGKTGTSNSEIMQNIYSTNGHTNEENDKWYNRLQNALGLTMNGYDEDNISMNLYDKSIWDVLTTCSYLGPDFIVAVHPFDFRNTIFMGRQYAPLKYGYETKGGKATGIAMKPFKQLHAFDSYTSIIGNSIKATEDNMRTVAIGAYMDNGEIATTEPIYADIHIWPEKQRVVNVDTTMNAKGVRIVEKIPVVGSLLNKPFKWKFDTGVAMKITAAQLRDYMKDMYDGYLTVLGYPSIKPFDGFYLNDSYNEMTGQLDVKEVTQILNYDVGFVTLLKPDLVVANRDQKLMTIPTMAAQFAAAYTAKKVINKMLMGRGYTGASPLVTAIWSYSKSILSREKIRVKKAGTKIKGFKDKLTGRTVTSTEIQAIENNRTGETAKKSLLKKALSKGSLKELLKKVKYKGNISDLVNNVKTPKNKKAFEALKKILNKTGSVAKNLKKELKIAIILGQLTNPVGWVATAIESIIIYVTTSTIGEMINRYALTSQAVIMSPIQRGGVEFSAGINGHMGSVVGDSPTVWRSILTSPFMAPFAALLKFDQNLFEPAGEYQERNIKMAKKSFAMRSSINQDNSTANVIEKFIEQNRHKVEVQYDDSAYQKMVENDAKALKGLTNLSEKRNATKADYNEQEESPTWKQLIDKFKTWIKNAFNWIKNTIKKMVEKLLEDDKKKGNESDPRDCAVANIKRGGKAVNLSPGMKHLGPIIERECRAADIGDWSELMKAMCMVESSGDYIKTPDCMQSSESLGKPRNYLQTPEASIKQAVVALKDAMRLGNNQCDEKAVIQAYNYGGQFAKYALTHNSGKWSFKTAKDFACKMRPGNCHYGNSEYIFRLAKFYEMPGGNGNCGEKDKQDSSNKNSSNNSKPPSLGSAKSSRSNNKNMKLQLGEYNPMKDISKRKESDYIVEDMTGKNLAKLMNEEVIEVSGNDRQMIPPKFKTVANDEMHKVKASDLILLEHENIEFIKMERFINATNRFHKGTELTLKIVSDAYYTRTGQKLKIAAGYTKDDVSWLGTGWGVEILIDGDLIVTNGKTRYEAGQQKENAKILIDLLLSNGFFELSCGDYDIVQEMKFKYGEASIRYMHKRATLKCNYVKE